MAPVQISLLAAILAIQVPSAIQFPQKPEQIEVNMRTDSYSDFEAFADSVRDVDITMTIQNPARHSWIMNHAYLPATHVQLGRLGSGNIAEGQSRPDGYILYLPLTDSCAYSANGTTISAGSFLVMEPGSEFCISTKGAHDWCSLFVPIHKLVGDRDGSDPLPSSEKTICRVTRPNRLTAHRFRALVHQVMSAAAGCPQLESSPAATAAELELIKIALSVVQKKAAEETILSGRPTLPRQKIVRCARELLEERGPDPVRVEELAAAAEVSERTLNTAFSEYLGVSPARYLQLRRLHQIRSALRAADPNEVSVSGVLAQHGEWQFGRFASRYRQLFGELPSQTLKTKRP